MNQSFETTVLYHKLGTDATQFRTPYGKLYLSLVIDFHTREVLAYESIEKSESSPNRKNVKLPCQRPRTIHLLKYVGVKSRVSIPSKVLSEVSS